MQLEVNFESTRRSEFMMNHMAESTFEYGQDIFQTFQNLESIKTDQLKPTLATCNQAAVTSNNEAE